MYEEGKNLNLIHVGLGGISVFGERTCDSLEFIYVLNLMEQGS